MARIKAIPNLASRVSVPYKITNLPAGSMGFSSPRMPQPIYGAPADDSPASLAIRAHEYGHLALSTLHNRCTPKTKAKGLKQGISNDWLEACYDVAVNAHLERNHVSISDLPLNVPNTSPDNFDREVLAQCYLRSRQLGNARAWSDYIGSELDITERAQLCLAVKSLSHPKLKDRTLLNIAAFLQDLFGDDAGFGTKEGKTKRGKQSVPKSLGAGAWGTMAVETLPLTCTQQRDKAPKRRPGFVGAFRYPNRATLPISDGMAFGQRKHIKGQAGVILIDASGSMHLEPQQLVELATTVPYGIIAAYEAGFRHGKLVILASHGRVASPESLSHYLDNRDGGNVIDGPALDWLGAQKGSPKIWVCDGAVTGIGDYTHHNLTIDAETKVRRYNIQRVPKLDIPQIKAALQGRMLNA